MVDVYFLTGLPFREAPLPAEPVLLGDGKLTTLGRRYYSREKFMSGSVVSIGAMDALVHPYVAAMIEGIWVPHDSVDQWWSAEDYGEGTGRRAFFLGLDAACQDGRAT